MQYYKTNAVYTALETQGHHSFVWATGNAWTLIYGDPFAEPKAIVLAYGKSWAKPENRQRDVVEVMKKLASRSGLPLFFVTFDDASPSIDKVGFGRPGQTPTEITLDELKDEFDRMGLPVKKGACGKSVNDATSSAYHNWQRDNLGAIKVTDIDLIRLDSANEPVEAIELKRSYISLSDWTPFTKDYVNFNLLLNVCQKAGLEMNIAYNVRHKSPFHDDISRLAMFSFRQRNTPSRLGEFVFQDFVLRRYGSP